MIRAWKFWYGLPLLVNRVWMVSPGWLAEPPTGALISLDPEPSPESAALPLPAAPTLACCFTTVTFTPAEAVAFLLPSVSLLSEFCSFIWFTSDDLCSSWEDCCEIIALTFWGWRESCSPTPMS